MARKQIAIVGAGAMARVRGRAFLDTGQADICAVASQHLETAKLCATELNCDLYYDDFRRLVEIQPDAILIETPHKAQDEIAIWALESGIDLLIGGSIASCLKNAHQIKDLATRQKRIVEAGYQNRYNPAWEEVRQLIQGDMLGEPIMAISMALWKANPHSWYYDQKDSGGMPLTHMSYCSLNAFRWILGKPISVSAVANRKVETSHGLVSEETCAVLVQFDNDAIASATASYVAPEGMTNAETRFICTRGGIEMHQEGETGTVSITLFHQGRSETRSFVNEPSPFVRQAEAFLRAIETRNEARNPPDDALLDAEISDAISLSAREHCSISLNDQPLSP